MTLIPPVLHRGARAITPQEFIEAIQATCTPRFPHVHGHVQRNIGLAISGGVDSMALAYLTTKISRSEPWVRVADNPISRPYAIVVDHGLREGSLEEAENVGKVLKDLGLWPTTVVLRWRNIIPPGVHPKDVPNIETLARQHRYRRMASVCRYGQIAALLTAHHEDDQYETVLMRLLSGHGCRGLQGMRAATDIPECYDIHGAYQSGFIDDQRRQQPFYKLDPNGKEKKLLRRHLRNEVDPAVIAREVEAGLSADVATAYLDDYDGIASGSKRAPPLAPLEIENGGITVYRPLLAFSKERLIATCVENNIPWFEDHTNTDRTLTLRNAVRHMVKHHTLPVALQKPAVLRLAERCRERVKTVEDEADRALQRVQFHEFGPNAGTLVVTPPRFPFPTVPRLSAASPVRRRKRIAHYRHIAALVLRRLLAVVGPERELSQPAQLAHLVSMLFPSLCHEGAPPVEPKPYVICGVLFTPLPDKGDGGGGGDGAPRWLLSRAPHVSNVPRPGTRFAPVILSKRLGKHPSKWRTMGWSDLQLFDGRYWVRLLHRLPCRLRVAPFEPEHHKPFREALPDDQARRALAAALRRYAPGKIRYTLPAIYATQDVTRLLRGEDWWPPQFAAPRPPGPAHTTAAAAVEGARTGAGAEPRPRRNPSALEDHGEPASHVPSRRIAALHDGQLQWEKELTDGPDAPVLLALPTLDVGLPGLESWLRWEVRYKKVDGEVLRLSRLGGLRIVREDLRARVMRSFRRTRRVRGTAARRVRWRGV